MVALIFISFFAQLSQAQTIPNIKSIPIPTGSGARALGQGGAFIAIADDATASSWNPAGLINLERPELSMVGSYIMSDQDYSTNPFTLPGTTMGNEDVSRWDLNFLSAAYPFIFLDKNVTASINYHQIRDFHLDLSISQSTSQKAFDLNQQLNFKSSGGIGALSPGLAVLLLENLSLGITFNIYDDEFFGAYAWKESNTITGQGMDSNGDPISTFARFKTSSKDYHGLNTSIGLLWDVCENGEKRLTFGSVFHTPYTARFDQETSAISKQIFGGVENGFMFDEESRVKMDWPMSGGIGLGFMYSHALSFAFDATWTDWSEWVQKTDLIKVNGKRNANPATVNSRPIGGGSEHDEIDDAFDLRLGTEYLFIRKYNTTALRGGLFYEQRPSLGSPSEFNGEPTDVWGFSLGAGYTTGHYSLDCAYQFRYVRDMEGNDIGLPGTTLDAVENMFLTSLIVYF